MKVVLHVALLDAEDQWTMTATKVVELPVVYEGLRLRVFEDEYFKINDMAVWDLPTQQLEVWNVRDGVDVDAEVLAVYMAKWQVQHHKARSIDWAEGIDGKLPSC